MINSSGSSVMHVARIGTDLIYATSYDKPQEYVDELLAEVGRLVMREVSARACEGGATPRYALDVARERSHSAKHPLMVRGYLASNKTEQSGARTQLTSRNRSARDSRLTASGTLPSGQKLLFYRPEGRCRTLGQQQQQQQQPESSASSRPPVTRAAWESCSAVHTDGLHRSHDGASTEDCIKPNKATLLRSMSSESSIWDAQIERLPKSQRVSARCRQQAKDSDRKLKLMNRDFARSAETLHGFLVGAQYNRSRGVVEAVTMGLSTDNVEHEQAIKTSVNPPASSVSDNVGEESRRKARPFSAMPESTAWSQQHADSPPLYARPYSSIVGCPRRPASDRPLSALQKAITIRQLPSSSLRGYTPQNTLKSKAQFAATGIAKNCLPASTQNLFESSSPMKVTGLGTLQVVSQRVLHTHSSLNVEQHRSGMRSGNSVVGTLLRVNQMTREPPLPPERPFTGLYNDDANDMCIDGQGLNRRTVEPHLPAFGSDLSAGLEFGIAGLSHSDTPVPVELREASGSSAQDGAVTVEAPASLSKPLISDLLSQNIAVPEVGDTVGEPPAGGSRLSIHVDVAMLDDDDDERSRVASENGDANLYTDVTADQ